MRTLDVTRLSSEDLGGFCAIEQMNWSVLNESVVLSLLVLRKEVEERRKEIVEMTNLLKHTVLHPEQVNASEIIKRIFRESKQLPPLMKKGKLRKYEGDETRDMSDIPDGFVASGLSSHLGELITVVGLRGCGGSMATGGLSARGLPNVAVGDWSDHFTFVIGNHPYRCPSSVAYVLSPRVSKLQSIDATISELRLEVEYRDKLFGSVLEAAKGNSIAVDSDHRGVFEAIYAALWNSELCELVCGQLSDEVTMENVVDRLRFLSANRCDISAELEFVASYFDDFLPRPQTLTTLPFSLLYDSISRGSLRIESEGGLYDFISNGTTMNPEMFCLLEFARFEYCSIEVMNDLFDLLWESFSDINASMRATVCARLILPNVKVRLFPPSVKKGKLRDATGSRISNMYGILNGIIAHVTRKCRGNVHDHHVVDVTSDSFEKGTEGANPHSGAYDNDPQLAAKNIADLENGSRFVSAGGEGWKDIPHTKNNCLCYDFNERRFVPTDYTMRSIGYGPGNSHLKSWLIETSGDGENWQEVAREENNKQLNGSFLLAHLRLRAAGSAVSSGW
jgi:hypothetical protein